MDRILSKHLEEGRPLKYPAMVNREITRVKNEKEISLHVFICYQIIFMKILRYFLAEEIDFVTETLFILVL